MHFYDKDERIAKAPAQRWSSAGLITKREVLNNKKGNLANKKRNLIYKKGKSFIKDDFMLQN